MIHLPRVLAAAGEVQHFCQIRRWPFCFIGGIAVQRWGEPRLTQDVDLTLLTGFGGEEEFVDALLKELMPRRSDAREFAPSRRVLLARTSSGVDVDVALGAFPFEERSVQRASNWAWAEGQSLITCSAEDLLVHKAFGTIRAAEVEAPIPMVKRHLFFRQVHHGLHAFPRHHNGHTTSKAITSGRHRGCRATAWTAMIERGIGALVHRSDFCGQTPK